MSIQTEIYKQCHNIVVNELKSVKIDLITVSPGHILFQIGEVRLGIDILWGNSNMVSNNNFKCKFSRIQCDATNPCLWICNIFFERIDAMGKISFKNTVFKFKLISKLKRETCMPH